MDAKGCREVASGVVFAPARPTGKAKGSSPKPWKRATSTLIDLINPAERETVSKSRLLVRILQFIATFLRRCAAQKKNPPGVVVHVL
jgi:hypothetical protein